ncbi:Clc chloride channel [Rhizoclosmatium globosum]|uniref:Clc chloride channel n=1 Tax=Rhizoclosmatium globosum TaxID=329046 RepID=A0A1Y2CW50_9FUNG|nr:Clc chloride channel [Rhizoclosmatium globosum]|eukprot:ORY51054.1 Clc chloride channel [Rhizoclosmatium globosum]
MTEVIAFLNGASALNSITLPVLAVKYLGIFGVVSAGLFSGIDGPMSEIGAGVAMVLVQQFTKWTSFRKLLYGETLDLGLVNDKSDVPTALKANQGSDAILDHSRVEHGDDAETARNHKNLGDSLLGFLMHRNLRLFATIGAAVSLAVIFGAPIGGVLFAVEEATSFFELSLLIKLTFATVMGYLITAYTHYDISAKIPFTDLLLNPVKAALLPLNSTCNFEMRLPMILMYIAGGVIGAIFGQFLNLILSTIQRKRKQYLINVEEHRKKIGLVKPVNKKLNAFLRISETVIIAVITALVVCWIPTAKSVDECTSYERPLTHIRDIRPQCDFFNARNPLTCENLAVCRDVIANDGLCFPTETEFEFNNFVVETYQEYCAPRGILESPSDISSSDSSESVHGRSAKSAIIRELIYKLPNSNVTANDYVFRFNPESVGIDEFLMKNEDDHCYYQVRSLFWTSPERQLKMLLLRGVYNIWSFKALLVFLAVYIVMSCLTYYVALPTDLVVPNLIMGATAGRILGMVLNEISPGYVDPGAFALLGMAACWSGTSGLVLTVIAVTLELTGDFSYLPALIIVRFQLFVSSVI